MAQATRLTTLQRLAGLMCLMCAALTARAGSIPVFETTDFSNDSSAPTALAEYDPASYSAGLKAGSITVEGTVSADDPFDFFVFSGLFANDGIFVFTFSPNTGQTLANGVLVVLNSSGGNIAIFPTDTPLTFADNAVFTGRGIIPADQIAVIGLRNFGQETNNYIFTVTANVVTPEPSTLGMAAIAIVGLMVFAARRRAFRGGHLPAVRGR